MKAISQDDIKRSERKLFIFFLITFAIYFYVIAQFIPDNVELWESIQSEMSHLISQLSNPKNYQ